MVGGLPCFFQIFISIRRDELPTALRPPSPLQNFWSLSVEEQFYLIYPSLFLWSPR